MAPVEAIGISVHGKDGSDAAAHDIQVFPLAVGVILPTGEFCLEGAEVCHVDVCHIIGLCVCAAPLGVLCVRHRQIGAGICGMRRDHRVSEVLCKLFPQADGLCLPRSGPFALRDLLV